MPTQIQLRRGNTSQNDSFTGASGELTVDTTRNTIRVHDGSTAGGEELLSNTFFQAETANFLSKTETSSQTIVGEIAFSNTVNFNTSGAIKLPVGTVDQRPTEATGQIRFNSTATKFEAYDGTVWQQINTTSPTPTTVAVGMGIRTAGRLGDNLGSGYTTSPVTVAGGITTWSSIATADSTTLALTSDGIIYAWGAAGEIGDGASVTRSSPVTVVGGITTWSQVNIGTHNAGGVTSGGIAYAWGSGSVGALGDNTTVTKSSPVTIVGGITNWSKVKFSETFNLRHGLGLTATGVLYAWGDSGLGQLGQNTSTPDRSSPVSVIGGITWSDMAAGYGSSIGITSSGVAYAWGRGSGGQLGVGDTANKSSPVTIVGGITNWSSVEAGVYGCMAITDTGIAYGWGTNSSGQLGNNTTISTSSPVTVVGGITNWSQISISDEEVLGVTDSGVAYAWGGNSYGQLGVGDTVARSSPVTIVGGITTWTAVSAGTYHSVGIYTS